MNKKNNLFLIILSILLLMISFFYFIAVFYIENIIESNIEVKRNNIIKNEKYEIKKSLKTKELKLIKNQNNIHYSDFFEPLRTLFNKNKNFNIISSNKISNSKNKVYSDIKNLLIIIVIILITLAFISTYLISKTIEISFLKTMKKDIKNLNFILQKKDYQLQKKLHIDELTNLEDLYSLKEYTKKQEFSTLFIIDIDSFDNINKLYGYDIGDKVLNSYAKVLLNFSKNKEYKTYRLYSNTFALLSQKEEFKIDEYYKDINNLIHNKRTIYIKKDFSANNKLKIELDINIGVSLYEDKAINKANIALNEAKKIDKRFFIYNESLQDKKRIKDLEIVREEIIQAIKENNVKPFFQAIVDKQQNIEKYEVLMRLKKNSDEYLAPFYFLDTAIKTKLYKDLSKIIIEKAFKTALEYKIRLSINLSLSDIIDNEIVELLDCYLETDSILNNLITFEILENEHIQDIDLIHSFVQKYRKLGIKFALDDFGSGYSNFSNILTIKPDYIKIDGSLIKNIDVDKNSYELVKSILTFSKELNIKTIAEFIHKKEIFEITKELGVDMFQGYYFSKPLPTIRETRTK